jgi:rRNA maturation endonuclease Nob1
MNKGNEYIDLQTAIDEKKRKKEPKKKCPDCGSKQLSVYLVADYNSTVDLLNCEDQIEWSYSDTIHETFCDICGGEFEFEELVNID